MIRGETLSFESWSYDYFSSTYSNHASVAQLLDSAVKMKRGLSAAPVTFTKVPIPRDPLRILMSFSLTFSDLCLWYEGLVYHTPFWSHPTIQTGQWVRLWLLSKHLTPAVLLNITPNPKIINFIRFFSYFFFENFLFWDEGGGESGSGGMEGDNFFLATTWSGGNCPVSGDRHGNRWASHQDPQPSPATGAF